MNYDHRGQQGWGQSVTAPREGIVHDGLWVTYRWMAAGLGVTGVVAMAIASSPAALEVIFGNRLVFYALLFAQLGMAWAFNGVAARASTAVTAAMFFAFAAITGTTMSAIFLVYTAASIASVFFVTAGAFAGLSVVGLVTKHDLSAIGRFAIFALIGIILASIVNMFLASRAFDFVLSFVGVLVFGALTAYDTQKLKNLFANGGAVHGNLPLVGALVLYLDFINMFLFLLRLFGRRR